MGLQKISVMILDDVMLSPTEDLQSGIRLINDFSITIEIRRKFHLAVIQLFMIIRQQKMHMPRQYSCRVMYKKIVAINSL